MNNVKSINKNIGVSMKSLLLSLSVVASVGILSGCEFSDKSEILQDYKNDAYTQEFSKSFEGTGKVVIEEFSDIECPACKGFAPTYERLEKAFVENENIEFRYNHYPLESIHRYAYAGALATECAGKIGGEKARFEYLHLAFAEEKLSTKFYRELRKNKNLGFTVEQQENFLTCFNEKQTSSIIKNHKKEGDNRGLRGTPTVYINGKEYAGKRTYDALFIEINSKLN